MSMISELIDELIDNADLYTKELHDLMYKAANTIKILSKKVREQKQGKWIDKGDYAICSNCGAHSRMQYDGLELIPFKTRYCYNCGAKMKEVNNDIFESY